MAILKILPATFDIEVVRGTDNAIEFQLTDAAGAAVDITADTVKFTARKRSGGAIAIATKTNGAGDHQTPLEGKTRFKLSRTDLADTANVGSVSSWHYEVRRVVGGAGDEVVYIAGQLKLVPTSQPA